jgi:hypothetical protein
LSHYIRDAGDTIAGLIGLAEIAPMPAAARAPETSRRIAAIAWRICPAAANLP